MSKTSGEQKKSLLPDYCNKECGIDDDYYCQYCIEMQRKCLNMFMELYVEENMCFSLKEFEQGKPCTTTTT